MQHKYAQVEHCEHCDHHDRGQVTVLAAGVLLVAAMAIVALAMIGEAMIHRARARSAADAVALAAAVDSGAADQLVDWYGRQGVDVSRAPHQTTAASGPSRAAAWASQAAAEVTRSPALVATLARAEQLVGASFRSARWSQHAVTLSEGDAAALAPVAAELGLCEEFIDPAMVADRSFGLCFVQLLGRDP